MGLYRAGADACQLGNILNGITVHIVLQDGAFRAGQRIRSFREAAQPRLHIGRQRTHRSLPDHGQQLVNFRNTGCHHLRCTAPDRRKALIDRFDEAA